MDLNLDIKEMGAQIKRLLVKNTQESESNGAAEKSHRSEDITKSLGPLTDVLGKYTYEHETMLGVELTPHYVRVCQMKQEFDRWTFMNLASSCIENQFRKQDILMNPDLYVENLKDLITKNNIKAKDVAFTLPTSSSIIKVLRVPDMDEEDFKQAAALGSIWESYTTIEGGAAEYSIYYKILRHNPSHEVTQEQAPMMESEGAPSETSVSISEEIAQQPTEQMPIEEPVETALADILQEQPAMDQLVETPEIPVIEGVAPGVDEIAAQMEPTVENAEPEQVVSAPSMQTGEITEDVIPPESADINLEMQPMEVAPETIPTEIPMDTAIAPDMGGVEPVAMEAAQEPQGPTMDVLFIASKLMDINLHADIIRNAGLNPVLADIRCLALKHAFESHKDNAKDISIPFAFLEFGPDENYVFVLDGDNTNIYNIYVSDDDINNIINNSDNEAMLQQFIQNYANQVQQTLEDHEKQYDTAGINSLFVSSSAPLHVDDASAAPLIKTFVRSISKLLGNRRITECDFCNHIVVPEQFAKQVNAEGNIAAWASTVGAATRKLDIFEYEEDTDYMNMVNLLPNSEKDKKGKRTSILSTLAVAAVFALVMVGVVFSFILINRYASALTKEAAAMAEVEPLYNSTKEESTRLTVVLNQVNSLDTLKDSLPSNQGSILTAYKKITEVIPEGVWLEEVNFSKPNKIEIKGNAVNDSSILRFVGKLNEGSQFIKMSLKEMEMEEDKKKKGEVGGMSEVKKFTVEGLVAGNVDNKSLEILAGGEAG